MKRSLILIATLIVSLTTAFLWGCGGGGGTPGQPGSQGTEDNSITIEATLTPFYLGGNTFSVDVHQIIDCDPVQPGNQTESITTHSAILRVQTRPIDPNTNSNFEPKTLFVEKYTIEYRRSGDSIGAPPILTDTRRETIVIPPAPSILETTIVLADLIRKDQYLIDITSGQYASSGSLINNYTATFTFEGKSENGTPFIFQAQTNFEIGSFDYCDASN